MFREGLQHLLHADSSLCVVGQAADGPQTIALARSLTPDIILLDLGMPQTAGLETIVSLTALPVAPRVLALAAAIDPAGTMAALAVGARGVVPKTSVVGLLISAIGEVIRGRYWVGNRGADTLAGALASVPKGTALRSFGLTPRELEIVAAVSSGRTNREIAEALRLSEETVKHHLTSIFDKTGASTRLELALFVVHHRLTLLTLASTTATFL